MVYYHPSLSPLKGKTSGEIGFRPGGDIYCFFSIVSMYNVFMHGTDGVRLFIGKAQRVWRLMVVAAEVAGERRPAMPLLTMPLLVIHSWQLGVGVVLTRNVQSCMHAWMAEISWHVPVVSLGPFRLAET